MHYLPGSLFRSKDVRNPQSDWGELLTSANLDPGPLHPHDVGKLRGHVLLYELEAASPSLKFDAAPSNL